MSAFHDIILAGASGQQGYRISRSVRLRSSASAYFNRTLTTPTNNLKWTWSGWVKRGALSTEQLIFGAGTAPNDDQIGFRSDDTLWFLLNNGASYAIRSNAVYRDPSGWYHIVAVFDSANATASNRLLLYVNGVQITSFAIAAYPTQNYSPYINSAISHRISSRSNSTVYLDGYVTEINFIDGQALTPSSFGETDSITGVWKPKKYAGTYGTNGFYLNFSDNSNNTSTTIGKDSSGNGNNWTPNNISVTAGTTYDSMIDVPTPYADGGNGRGNYAVMNPIGPVVSGTLSDGNLTWANSGSVYGGVYSTFAVPTTGKWYFEAVATSFPASSWVGIGFSKYGTINNSANAFGQADTCYYGTRNGVSQTILNGATTVRNGSNIAFAANDILMMAYDADTGKVWFGKNGLWFDSGSGTTGDPSSGTNQTFTYSYTNQQFVWLNNFSSSTTVLNFGQRPFTYTPPTGFKALNTQNLPDSTIKKGGSAMNTVLVTGTGSNQSITGYGFAPDLVWIKKRSAIEDHKLFDTVRGAINRLSSNTTGAETTDNDLYGFTADGFDGSLDASATYAAWGWKESVTAGFDIVTYTGTGSGSITVNHNLGVTPAMWIIKDRTLTSTDWLIGHKSLSANYYLLFNTSAASNASTPFVSQSSSNIVLSGSQNLAQNYVAYLFAEVAGFSKFGSYVGNGSTDGVFVYLGFRPRFILAKASSGVADWVILDTARDDYNGMQKQLFPNLSNAESSGTVRFDALSNGFKLRVSSDPNSSGVTYIYAAFAENPTKYALAR
jgi:hypothetical protein